MSTLWAMDGEARRDAVNLHGHVEFSCSIEIEDRDLHDRLVGLRPEIRAEVVGGRWDGLEVVYDDRD